MTLIQNLASASVSVSFCVLALAASAVAQQTPTPAAAEWWHQTTALANDSMEGRDTGTEAYERAAKYVAAQFAAVGLKAAGDNSTFFQSVPMHQVDLDATHSSVAVETGSGDSAANVTLKLLQDVTLQPNERLPKNVRAGMMFIGYGLETNTSEPSLNDDEKGKVLVYFAGTPSNLPAAERQNFAARRAQRLASSGAIAIVAVLNPHDIEPFHWPAAYARSVSVAGASIPGSAIPSLRVSATAAATLFSNSGADLARILSDGERGAPLPNLDLHANLRLHLEITAKDISSPNILAILPGSDPALAPEYVALSAHLDGYGYGTPVLGDRLYNGALDDAAYVATLLELARTQAALPPAQRPRRSLLFCIFTGEEKGLLGSAYFTQHPTVPMAQIVADLNLDQLRPIFPLKILTMEGIADSTLGDTAAAVAHKYGIELRPDLEPERNLFRRADNYNFVRSGVPVAGFIFGYNRGTPEEAIYRDWYARRYHKPQDDLTTPIDWQAAVTFNDFFRDLARAVADTPNAPHWLPSSPNRPKSPAR